MKKSANFKNKRFGKIIKIVAIIVAFYAVSLFLLLGPLSDYLVYPNMSRAQYYEAMTNWNLPVYGVDDFDHDGETDIVFSQGCAVLTARDESTIPADKQCRFSMFGNGKLSPGLPQDRTIGEKYTAFNGIEMTWGSGGIHSYMIKQDDASAWNIVSFSQGKLSVYEIGLDGYLTAKKPSFALWTNEILYVPTHILSQVVVDPLIFATWVLQGFGYIIFPLLAVWFIFAAFYLYFRKRIFSA